MNIEAAFLELGDTPTQRLLTLMARLRDPDTGCPWDAEQSYKTIAPYTIEEAYEVSDAIDNGDLSELQEELGDLLFQVVFHSKMAEEDGAFNFYDVCDRVVRKMISRHPHVFGDAEERDSKTQIQAWESVKAAERSGKSADKEIW